MFDPASVLLFMTANLALNLAPGPDMLYVSTRSLTRLRPYFLASSFREPDELRVQE